MTKRRRKKSVPLPLMMMELALASWETVGHRSLLIARGKCLPSEYSPDGDREDVGRCTVGGLAFSIRAQSRLDCGSGSLAPTCRCECSPIAAQVT